jgi:hypothetical protein
VTDPAIAVCGFGRCGSTMAMRMLAAGGVPIAGPANPPHELADIRQAWDIPLAGRAVKLLDGVLRFGMPPAESWRVLWLDRSPVQQSRSHIKFLTRWVGLRLDEPPARAASRMADSYRRDRARALRLLGKAGPVLVLRYEDVLAAPNRSAQRMRDALWPDLDVAAAAAVVHWRDGRCRPDLTVEAAYSRAAAAADRVSP